jgi:hypothetical protein
MKADRTAIVVGGFLAVIGLLLAVNGYSYVQLERGWSLLLSGTMVFCTGLVLVAVGLVLKELEAISSSVAKTALFLAKGKLAAPLEQQNGAPPAMLPPAPAFEPFSPPEETVLAPAPAPATMPAPPVDTLPKAAEPKPVGALSWMVKQGRPSASPPAPPAAPVAAEPEPAPDEEKPKRRLDDWLDEALAFGEPRVPDTLPPAPAPQPEPIPVAAEPEKTPEPEPEAPLAPEPAAPAASLPAAPAPSVLAASAASEPAAHSEVIGRYEAHGAHYTMYADGSIDAETAHGLYRFASMEELKRFIEGQA